MTTSSTSGPLSLGDLVATVRRRWIVTSAVFIACLVASAAVGHLWPVSYQASATVAVQPVTAAGQTVQSDVNMATEQVLVTSQVVATRAAATAGEGVTGPELQKRTTITVPTESNALQIAVTASSPKEAAREANALATAYLDYRTEQGKQAATAAVSGLDGRISVLKRRLGLQTDLRKRADTIQDITSLESQREGITAVVTDPGELVSSAVEPEAPSSPGLPLFLAGGMVAGAMLAFAAAVLRERLDRKIRSAARLQRHVPCRVLDARGETPAASARRVALVLAAARSSSTADESARVSLTAVPTARAARTPLVQRLRSSRGAHQVAVTAMTGRDGVAAAVAAKGGDRGVGIVCLADDHLSDVLAVVAELETWSSRADVVVIAEQPSGSPRQFLRRRREAVEPVADEASAPVEPAEPRTARLGSTPWNTSKARR